MLNKRTLWRAAAAAAAALMIAFAASSVGRRYFRRLGHGETAAAARTQSR